MRHVPLVIVSLQAALVVGFGVALSSGTWPLGVKGEWEWLRLPVGVRPTVLDLLVASAGVSSYAAFVGAGMMLLNNQPSRRREAIGVLGLVVAAVAVQLVVPGGAPYGYGLSKWAFALHNPGSTGYYTVARQHVLDPRAFVAAYPEWIPRQDSLHVGTHPPGLFVAEALLLRALESRPDNARWVLDHMPGSVRDSFREINRFDPLPQADRATLALTGVLTLLGCAATAAPLYGLARASLPASTAWVSAALWPLVPSAVLFQPVADTAFPLLSTSALALAAHARESVPGSGRCLALAAAAGLILALGMQFTLAFLPVGLAVALVFVAPTGMSARRRCLLVMATGLGFMVLTLAVWWVTRSNPFLIWWWNQKNHARFYVEYPRSYLAWVVANPIELVVGLGFPIVVWAVAGFIASARSVPPAAWATLIVLGVLNFSGRNLSEVARLWLPLMPPWLIVAGLGLTRLGGGPASLVATAVLLGGQTMLLQATIQVLYPV
jgi:hypothetical protein